MESNSRPTPPNLDAIAGCLTGTAVGDAIGLPYEGVSPRRAPRLLGPPDRHRLLFGRGLFSDDTEHTCMVLQSLLAANGDVTNFQRDLARRLRWWLITLPAGTGRATAQAILKLWLGFPPPRSGVFSAGNGPAMRSAILGVMLPLEQISQFVKVSSELTHSDPKAFHGAMAIALAAHLAARQQWVTGDEYLALLSDQLHDTSAEELLTLITQAIAAINNYDSTQAYCDSLGMTRGVSGYVYQTVPISIHAWLRHQSDYRSAIQDVIRCGGDADTTAAIVGGIIGSSVGPHGIPEGWKTGIVDWPLSTSWIDRLAEAATMESGSSIPTLSVPSRLIRNLLFLPLVLAHGFRRLAPPY